MAPRIPGLDDKHRVCDGGPGFLDVQRRALIPQAWFPVRTLSLSHQLETQQQVATDDHSGPSSEALTYTRVAGL